MIQVGCTQPVVQDAAADGRFDGVYAGTRTQDAACGSLHQAVVFHVAGSRITVESRHKRRRLSGTVSAGGEVALSDYSGGRQITGTIGNGRIVATEAVSVADNGKHQESGQNDPAAPSCLWRFEAVRTVGPAPEGAQE